MEKSQAKTSHPAAGRDSRPSIDACLSPTHLTLAAQILLPITLVIILFLALGPTSYVPFASILGDKVLHIGAFFVLAGLLDIACQQLKYRYKLFWLTTCGLSIELAQSFIPLRDFSIGDLLADIFGSCLYFASTPLLKRLPFIRLRWRTERLLWHRQRNRHL